MQVCEGGWRRAPRARSLLGAHTSLGLNGGWGRGSLVLKHRGWVGLEGTLGSAPCGLGDLCSPLWAVT